MSLQTIIDSAETIEFKRQKLTGQTISRSGIVKTATVANFQPWQITVTVPDGLKYSQNRHLVEELDRIDRSVESTIDIGKSRSGLSYITGYQGEFTASQLANITLESANASTLTLNVSAVSGEASTDILLEPGDFIQPQSHTYPYTVTQQVLRGIDANTVTVPIHRPYIEQTGFSPGGQSMLFGSDVTWRVILLQRPAYRVIPYDILSFTGSFEIMEVIQEA